MSAEAGTTSEFDSINVTVTYNLARLLEERDRASEAEEKYKALLAEHPNYIDAFLRLASIERGRGKPKAAIGWLKKALDVSPADPDLWCLLGTIQVEIGDVVAADSSFRRVLTKAVERGDAHENCKKDAYATISLANIQVANADHKNQERLDKATEIFRTVLEKEPANLYAANGIGVVCVDKGRLDEARQIFSQVREASAECIPAQRNLALLSVMQGEHAAAGPQLTKLQRRAAAGLSTDDRHAGHLTPAELHLVEARVHFESGRVKAARQSTSKALRLRPDWVLGWHNLALVLVRSAKNPQGSSAPPRRVAAVIEAQKDLAEAVRACAAVAAAPEAARKAAAAEGLTTKREEGLKKACADMEGKLAAELLKAQEREAEIVAEQQQAEERTKAFQAEREAKAKAEAEAREAAAAEEAARIAAAEERLASRKDAWAEQDRRDAAAAKEAAEKGRKRKAKAAGEDVSPSASDDDEAPAPAAGADGDDVDDAALFGEGDDDDDDDPDHDPTADGGDADGDGDAAANGDGAAAARRRRRRGS